jgi:hypothetical protein
LFEALAELIEAQAEKKIVIALARWPSEVGAKRVGAGVGASENGLI